MRSINLKRGDSYLRMLLIHGSRSVICHAKRAKSHDRLRLGVEAPEPVAPQRGRGRAREQARPDRVGGVEEREGLRVNAGGRRYVAVRPRLDITPDLLSGALSATSLRPRQGQAA